MTCGGCGRANAARRRYCGGCGANLAPRCGRCGFDNDADDRYCGGCGDQLAVAAAEVAALPPLRASVAPPPAAPAGGDAPLTRAELDDLLAGLDAPAAAVVALPAGAIGQDDLDRLFGGDA